MQVVIALIALGALVVSGVAIVPAFMALHRAKQANDLAVGANQIAAGANQLSATANGIALAAELRARESHDVQWAVGYLDESAYLLFNEGLDTAYRVRAHIRSSGGPRGILRAETTVPPGRPIAVPAPLDTALVRGYIEGYDVAVRVHWFSVQGVAHSVTLTVNGESVVRRGTPKG